MLLFFHQLLMWQKSISNFTTVYIPVLERLQDIKQTPGFWFSSYLGLLRKNYYFIWFFIQKVWKTMIRHLRSTKQNIIQLRTCWDTISYLLCTDVYFRFLAHQILSQQWHFGHNLNNVVTTEDKVALLGHNVPINMLRWETRNTSIKYTF